MRSHDMSGYTHLPVSVPRHRDRRGDARRLQHDTWGYSLKGTEWRMPSRRLREWENWAVADRRRVDGSYHRGGRVGQRDPREFTRK